MTTISVENVTQKARNSGSAILDSLPKPVTDATQMAYDKVVGGVQWYVEQWEDLIEEARELHRVDLEEIEVSDVLAGLTVAKVASDIPGRLRVRTEMLEKQTQVAQQCAEKLDQLDGIEEIQVSALTGSVLIFYDSQKYESRDALLSAVAKA